MAAQRRRVEIVQLVAIAAAVVAWLGWFEIAPALGFPTIGPAAMLNRVFVPESDPGVWFGWSVLVVGFVAVAALYWLATTRDWFPSGVVTGSLYAIAAWAIAGAVVMVIIGRISPPPPAPPPPPGPPLPTTPDPMHATFMMLHLGMLAPLSALIAWVLFGAVVGAAAASQEPRTRAERRPVRPSPSAAVVLVAVAALATGVLLSASAGADVRTQDAVNVQTTVLAEGPAEALPEGATFVSVIELPQAAGATLGPHAHIPGFAYVLDGRETIAFQDRPTMELDSGEGGFMGGLEIHSHQNRKGRAPAGVLALGLVVLGASLAVASLARMASRALVAGLSGLLLVAGAVALWNPWANDWYFVGIRPEATRGGVMPLPNSSRTYESPVLEGLPPGPYTEELRLITVPPGAAFTVDDASAAEMMLVLDGQAEVRVDGESPRSLGASEATLAQPGASMELSNPSSETIRVLTFRVTASAPGA